MPKLSVEIENAIASSKHRTMTFGDFIETISINGHMLPVTILTCTFLLPIPIPGLSVIFGTLVTPLGLAMAFEVHPWIPESIRKRAFSEKLSSPVFKYLAWGAKKLEKLTRPRLLRVSLHRWNYRFNGLVIAICGIILAIPLPPGGDTLPAINILVLSIADIEDDGALILFGYLLFALNAILYFYLFTFGQSLLQSFF